MEYAHHVIRKEYERVAWLRDTPANIVDGSGKYLKPSQWEIVGADNNA